jgi:hypothetical protein
MPMRLIVLLFILVGVVSCKVGYMELTNTRQTYLGNEIKTNGYYYCIDTLDRMALGKPIQQVLARVYFFYRNGVLNYSVSEFNDYNLLEKYLADTTYHSNQINPYDWGIYLVEGHRMKIEKWSTSTGGKHPNFTFYLSILSDTSLHNSYGNNTYYFKSFSPKPDSVNRFIK